MSDSAVAAEEVGPEPGEEPPAREELAERIDRLEREKDAEIQKLRSDLQEVRAQKEELEDTVDYLKEGLWEIEDSLYGDYGVAMAQTRTQTDKDGAILPRLEDCEDHAQTAKEVDQRITNEQKTRSRQDGKLRREINKLADEVGVDLNDADVSGEDKIQRLIAQGPDDIADRVYPVHNRAREVLLHAGEWGRTVDDQFGKRITFTAPAVREKLELTRDETLQSKQVRDVFEKIVELAEDSPRKARVGKTDDGNTRLLIHLQQEEM